MGAMLGRIRNAAFLLRNRRYADILGKLSFRLSSDTLSYGLKRDLTVPFQAPPADIPITVRPLCKDDVPVVFDLKRADLGDDDRKELVTRLEHLHANIPTCYVAVTEDGCPTYIQWLMGSAQNAAIQEYFNGTFPVLRPDEALLENAYTLRNFRGKKIMASAMARIAEQGNSMGVRTVITFVERQNIPSLKGCLRAGFKPYAIRHERWFLFFRWLTFEQISEDAALPGSINEGQLVTPEGLVPVR